MSAANQRVNSCRGLTVTWSGNDWHTYNTYGQQVDYDGVAYNEYGWWYVRNGSVDFNYTGLAANDFGWWYIRGGHIDFGYTGLASNENGTYYVKYGRIDFNYYGPLTIDGKTYDIVRGRVNDGTLPSSGGYYIRFDGNGADGGSMGNTVMPVNAWAALPANRFTRAGYSFSGWRTVKSRENILNGTSAPYHITSGVKDSNYTNGFWRSASGGSGTRSTDSISDPPCAEVSRGFRLTGAGNTDVAQDGVPVQAGASYTLSAYVRGSGKFRFKIGSSKKNNYMVYETNASSGWNRVIFSFTMTDDYMYNGKSTVYLSLRGSTNDIQICGVKMENGSAATDYTAKGSNGTAFADKQSVSNLTSNGNTVTLYAMWQADNYTVNFNGNGADSGSMVSQTLPCAAYNKLLNNNYERNGYIFRGWNTSPDGSGTHYGNQQGVIGLAEKGQSITLYAEWTESAGKMQASKIMDLYPGGTQQPVLNSQGGCIAKRAGNLYAVVCFIRNSSAYLQGNSADYASSVVMYDMASGQRVKTKEGLELHHANGMCYNPDNGHFYVARYGDAKWQQGIAELDWDFNLVTVHPVSGAENIGDITYYGGYYYGMVPNGSGGYYIAKLDGSLQVISRSGTIDGYEDRFVGQGITTDGTHIYGVSADMNDPDWRSHQRINVYDMNGNFVELGTTTIGEEIEDLDYTDGKFYAFSNRNTVSTLYDLK